MVLQPACTPGTFACRPSPPLRASPLNKPSMLLPSARVSEYLLAFQNSFLDFSWYKRKYFETSVDKK